MTGIDKTQRLLAQIRAAISSRPTQARRTGSAPDTAASEPSGSETSPAQLADSLRAEIRSLDLHTETGLRKGRRAFLQVVLLDEFGVALANDPRFAEVVDKVEAAMSQEDALRSDLDQLLAELAGR